MIRRQLAPYRTTSGSLLNTLTSCGAKIRNAEDTKARKTALKKLARHTACSARSGRFAPRFCPTSVAAADPSPQEGRVEKITIRIATVYPAVAWLPKDWTIRTITSQLAVAIR